jgi:hypothetical protein
MMHLQAPDKSFAGLFFYNIPLFWTSVKGQPGYILFFVVVFA